MNYDWFFSSHFLQHPLEQAVPGIFESRSAVMFLLFCKNVRKPVHLYSIFNSLRIDQAATESTTQDYVNPASVKQSRLDINSTSRLLI